MKKRKNDKKTVVRIISMLTAILILMCMLLMFVGCSANTAATNAEDRVTEYAIIRMPNGELVEGEVENWYFWSNGMVRVIIDGTEYVTHGLNVAMITK